LVSVALITLFFFKGLTEEVIQLLPTSGYIPSDSYSDAHTVPRRKQWHREVYNVGSCSAHSERIHSHVNFLINYHLDHSVRCAVFQHSASGAVSRVTEDRPVLLLTQKHESSTLHFAYFFVLWVQHHVSADNAIKRYRVTEILRTFFFISHVASKCPATLPSLLSGLITHYSL
jgi:hypothetical protein